ncbi:MAG: DUF4407 domain-containing protein [Bacteroidales bacterium]|jgi:hypothetical protein|nr:DUF4407 domain-containing protein [Bacteroidales bacterium]
MGKIEINAKYTLLQRVLWGISGNEIWLIKQCPTTYKYYSRQGLLFVTTFLFAAFCGGFAGHDFGGTWKITILFGLIWGLLVYSIDQMMVLTIDKVHVDKLSTAKKILIYFFPRIFLGILLALFMSSPLDHFLFKDQIEYQMQIDADSTWMKYERELKKTMDIEGTQNELKSYQSKKDSLSIAKGKNPNTVTFQEAQSNYERELPNLLTLEAKKNDKNSEKKIADSKVPIDSLGQQIISSDEYRVYLSKRTEYDRAVTDYNNKHKEVEEYKSIIKAEKEKYQKDLENRIAKQDTLVDKSIKKIESDKETVAVKTDEKQKFVKGLNGFDTKFMTLLTHPNFGVQFLRWFIFLVFLMIEILPTWMKLMGKPTEYDIKLDKIKNERIAELEKAIDEERQEAEDERKKAEIKRQSEIALVIEQEKQRYDIELENHRKILENIAEKQYNIAQMILSKWEEENKKQFSS